MWVYVYISNRRCLSGWVNEVRFGSDLWNSSSPVIICSLSREEKTISTVVFLRTSFLIQTREVVSSSCCSCDDRSLEYGRSVHEIGRESLRKKFSVHAWIVSLSLGDLSRGEIFEKKFARNVSKAKAPSYSELLQEKNFLIPHVRLLPLASFLAVGAQGDFCGWNCFLCGRTSVPSATWRCCLFRISGRSCLQPRRRRRAAAFLVQ